MWVITSKNLYQLIVSLPFRPPIWRRLLVRGDLMLDELHYVIQAAMGWTNSHMHQFILKGARMKPADMIVQIMSGTVDVSGGGMRCFSDPRMQLDDAADESRVRLDDLELKPKSKFAYEYDFGDGWDHQILVEKITRPDVMPEYPRCTAGAMACPPEDCGGLWGYAELLEILEDPNHPEHQERKEWAGKIDPEAFNLEKVNKSLQSMFRPRPSRKKKRKA